MKIQYQDLLNFLEEKPSKETLSDKLFQLGHEHEIMGDIFDMELTPNRGDCLSLLGLARDLKIFFGYTNNIEIYQGEIDPLDIEFVNLAPQDCPKISFLEIEIENSPLQYKDYLESYFQSVGNNKSNFFTDVSNFISYEIGQPTHCFDYDSIDINKKIYLDNKNCKNETFTTLLNKEVSLEENNLVFLNSDKIISLAGVMGGASTACCPATKKALIECAFFNPESIIGKSIKYNLISDAAHKFERGVDISIHDFALRRFIKVVQDHTNVKKIRVKTFASIEENFISIPINVNKINAVLGTSLQREEYLNYLSDFGFLVSNDIKVPSYRTDINSQNDLAEEVARAIGYDKINDIPLQIKKEPDTDINIKEKEIKAFLVNKGFNEVINYPFVSKKTDISINIDNPLDSNKANFRINLKESLLSNLLYNERRQKDSIKLFEISDVYTRNPEISYQRKLGIIVSGRVAHDYNNFSKKLNKKYFQELIDIMHSDFALNIEEISRTKLNSKKKDKIFYIELNICDIPDSFYKNKSQSLPDINFINYKPISDYPSSSRDFSFLISNLNKVNEVIEILENIEDEIIKQSFIFDFYKDTRANSIKLGCRFIFQSDHKTLSDSEINKKVEQILSPILKIEGVIIPGL